MFLNKLKMVVAALLPLALGASLLGWRASATGTEGEDTRAIRARAEGGDGNFRMVGVVRDEATGEPVAGATIKVMSGDLDKDYQRAWREAQSGEDGRYSVDLPPGYARALLLIPPVGYWVPNNSNSIESVILSQTKPIHRKDYVLRCGSVWNFRITRAGDGGPPLQGSIMGRNVDDTGLVRQTLPTEGGKVTTRAGDERRLGESVEITLERESGFRPDAVKSVTNLGGSPVQYRVVDNHGKIATVTEPERGRTEPRIERDGLVVHVTLPELDPKALGDLEGKVVDTSGAPIAGARVVLLWVDEQQRSVGLSRDDRHRAITDAQGNYRLRAISRGDAHGKPTEIKLAVTKEGYAGLDTRKMTFQPPEGEAPQIAKPVVLKPGASVSGTVVDPDGKPLPGVWVQRSGMSFSSRTQFTKTDAAGRFTVRDLPDGKDFVFLHFRFGKLGAAGKYKAGHGAEPVAVKLRFNEAAID